MDSLRIKTKRFIRRRLSIKKKIVGAGGRMRLCINRSNKNFFAQIVDDSKGVAVVALSTTSKSFPKMKNAGNINAAKELGKLIAKIALEKGIKEVVFDRNGFLYHGKIKAFADSARENGLEF